MNSINHNVVASISFKNASTALRDKAKFPNDSLSKALSDLREQDGVKEASILSTCNRTEIYLTHNQNEFSQAQLYSWWERFLGLEPDEIAKVAMYFEHKAAVEHIFRVASSLESLVVGEGQILAQVKDSYHISKHLNTIGLYQNKLFQGAIAIGKKVRTETEINQGTLSISFAAVELIKKVFANIESANIGIFGCGEMARLASLHLKEAGAKNFNFINRTVSKAAELASKYNAPVHALANVESVLSKLDIIVMATAAPTIILSQKQIATSLKQRKNANQIIVDIAAPRNSDPLISNLSSALLFDIDDLKQIVTENQSKRKNATKEAELIIEKGIKEYTKWYRSLGVVPSIKHLHDWGGSIKEKEFEKWSNKMDPSQKEILHEALNSMLGKFLHPPSDGIRKMADEGLSREAVFYLSKFFPLEEET